MKKKSLFLFLLLAIGAFRSLAQTTLSSKTASISKSSHDTLAKYLKSFQLFDLDLKSLGAERQAKGNLQLTLKLGDSALNLILEPSNVISFDYQSSENGKPVSQQQPEVRTYKGYLGRPENKVRLTISDDMIKGYITQGNKKLFIEQLGKYRLSEKADRSKTIIYQQEDIIAGYDGLCGVTTKMEKDFLKNSIDSKVTPQPKGLETNCRFLRIATEADFEFFQSYGTGTNAEILAIINMIQDAYLSTFNFEVLVVYQNVWTTSSDPYSGDPTIESGSETLVDQLRGYWNSHFANVNRSHVHLFTGRSFNAPGVTGRVYEIGTICRDVSKSYGFTRDRIDLFATTAHEIGHDLGAVHENGVNCNTANASIMCQGTKAIPLYFSTPEIGSISSHINNYGMCLFASSFFEMQGPDKLTCGGSANYSLPSIPGASYSWSIASPFIITSSPGPTSNSITLASSNYESGYQTLTCTISGVTDCPIVITKYVGDGTPPAPEYLYIMDPQDGNFRLCPNTTYQIEASGSTTTGYLTNWYWVLPPGWSSPNYGGGSNQFYAPSIIGFSIQIKTGPDPVTSFISVRGVNACGLGDPVYLGVSTEHCGGVGLISIYPNPADQEISVEQVGTDKNLTVQTADRIQILDDRGKVIKSLPNKGKQTKLTLTTADLPNGRYFLHVYKGKEITKKQIIIKH
ncbi:T9SS type A sorting domain-containing protein [Pedobacter alluvionis]|uniref:Putative secreted protein (Por secretion system target) n=1 Tax=Pedobacter alluvionis TaxID=475253 RepID=A0A497YAV9_9SPHI|nr:T9SS type A sorting domain-containing protein [Pedobacter alluvionis]RLJ80325.1 putative secreted protein (Por secretion system target) [Pedobacter alluvionis]TFB31595.1 T9SS type A sorting domain-containing protein [Pedobacter alluvionis]